MQSEEKKSNKPPAVNNMRIASFFARLFLLFSVWFVFYNMILKPPRILDRPLTNFIAASVAKCINIITPDNAVSWEEGKEGERANLVRNDKKVFGIQDVCNGIDLMFIYAGIIILLPSSYKRKIAFCTVGIGVIILANIVRVCALYFIFKYQQSAFDFSHHYLFTILMYLLIFFGWLLFIKKGKVYEKSL
jgi:exosortase/archaeosortase family protein